MSKLKAAAHFQNLCFILLAVTYISNIISNVVLFYSKKKCKYLQGIN